MTECNHTIVTNVDTKDGGHYCEECGQRFVVAAPTQPAPETGGEWSLSSAMVNDIMYRDHFAASGKKPVCIDIPEGDTGRTHYAAVVVCTGREHAAQIVADHNAVMKLVAALTDTLNAMEIQEQRETEEFHLSITAFRPIWDKAKNDARAALAAATGQGKE